MIDTHVHYSHKRFDCGRDELLQRLRAEHGLEYAVEAAIGPGSMDSMSRLLAPYEWIFYSAGYHPNTVEEDWANDQTYADRIRTFCEEPKVIAIGETGLDFHLLTNESDGNGDAARRMVVRQTYWFRKLVELALEKRLPLILHIRDDRRDILQGILPAGVLAREILREYDLSHTGGVVHCFAEAPDVAAEYLNMGLYLGIGGRITWEKALKETVRVMPLDRMVLETDSPFVKPVQVESGRNDSGNLRYVVQEIAKIRGLTESEVLQITTDNAIRLFRISRP